LNDQSTLLPEANLKVWDQFEVTDTRFTKPMDTGAGLTSINPEYQIKKFTEVFGPCGAGWGFTVKESFMVDGADMMNRAVKDDAGAPINFGPMKINTVRLELWYLEPLSNHRCVIEGVGHTNFVSMTKYGPFTDGDYEKKSVTDALTKAMSMLGMGGDVRMGQFDNKEYVEALQREEFIEESTDKQAATLDQRNEFNEWFDKTCGLMESATGLHELEMIFKTSEIRVGAQGTPDQKEELNTTKNERARALIALSRSEASNNKGNE
jgi:hypothetical protein